MRLIKFAAVVLSVLFSAGAHAALVSYQFSATIRTIAELDLQTSEFNSLQQTYFTGSALTVGDIITGRFQFDTSVGLGSYQPEPQPGTTTRLYDAAANDFITYRNGSTGYQFNSMPSLNWLGGSQVSDSVPVQDEFAPDYFAMNLSHDEADMYTTASLFFLNLSGDAFDDAAMPTSLDLSAFYAASVSSGFLRTSDGGWMMFDAQISALEPVAPTIIPEPGVAFLLLAGALAFGTSRYRRPGS